MRRAPKRVSPRSGESGPLRVGAGQSQAAAKSVPRTHFHVSVTHSRSTAAAWRYQQADGPCAAERRVVRASLCKLSSVRVDESSPVHPSRLAAGPDSVCFSSSAPVALNVRFLSLLVRCAAVKTAWSRVGRVARSLSRRPREPGHRAEHRAHRACRRGVRTSQNSVQRAIGSSVVS